MTVFFFLFLLHNFTLSWIWNNCWFPRFFIICNRILPRLIETATKVTLVDCIRVTVKISFLLMFFGGLYPFDLDIYSYTDGQEKNSCSDQIRNCTVWMRKQLKATWIEVFGSLSEQSWQMCAPVRKRSSFLPPYSPVVWQKKVPSV